MLFELRGDILLRFCKTDFITDFLREIYKACAEEYIFFGVGFFYVLLDDFSEFLV